ncbi:MAG: ribonuclease PH [Gemmatimonadota bacterium]|nr:MAG: ribonuclease PH [Gemmatimonadota bacterium]
MPRIDGRAADELRSIKLERGANPYAEGSCLVYMGDTRVMCTVSVNDGVPAWRRGSGLGWLTAEYAMLPRATTERTARERQGPGGRTAEIQRLIGRSLRAAIRDFEFGEFTLQVDCDVLQADGGTRTAAITGAAVAVADACAWMERERGVTSPFESLVAAVSVGIVDDEPRLDLCYGEDKVAQVDANVVMAEPDRYVEVQGSAEGRPFSRDEFDRLLELAALGVSQLFAEQRRVLGS